MSQQQQETARAQHQQAALVAQKMQSMGGRNGAKNFRDRNMFLNDKSGAKTVLQAGEGGKYWGGMPSWWPIIG